MILVHDKFATRAELEAGEKVIGVLRNVISCTRTIAVNGVYELSIKLCYDKSMFNLIKRQNVVRSPSNQLYFIYSYSYDTTNGTCDIRCKQIWYYLAGRPVLEGEIHGYACYWAIAAMMRDTTPAAGLVNYTFDYSSDIQFNPDDLKTLNFETKNKVYALLGAPGSICNLYGGEIYRNNFRFSINSKMEGSRENAFLIRDGFNSLGIKITFDDTDTVTRVNGADNLGYESYRLRNPDSSFSHERIVNQKYSYSDISNLSQDVSDYFGEHWLEKVSIEVSLDTLRRSSKDSEWLSLESYNVGDSGTVHIEELGYTETQRIIEQTYDELNGIVTSIKLGQYRDSILYKDRFSKLLAADDSSGRRLDALESSMTNTISKQDIQNLFR